MNEAFTSSLLRGCLRVGYRRPTFDEALCIAPTRASGGRAVEFCAGRMSELIGRIHDCALDTALWPAALELIRLELDFSSATLDVVALPSFAPIFSVATGIPDHWRAHMHDYGAEMAALWGGAGRSAARPLDEAIVQTHAASRAEISPDRYYNAWAKPQGLIDAVSIRFARDEAMFGSIVLGRHEDAGAVGERELAVLRLVAPHFRRAVATSKLFSLQAAKVQAFADSLEASAAAIVVVDTDIQVLHASGTAAAMLRSGDVVMTRRGVLRLADPGASSRLEAAIAAIAEDETALGPGVAIPIRPRSGRAAVAHVLPLRGGRTWPGLAPRAAATVLLTPAPNRPPLPCDAIATLFDLTPAEARVMELIAGSCTLAEIGHEIGIALSTVKTHLRHLFSKTGCRRQVELASLAWSLRKP